MMVNRGRLRVKLGCRRSKGNGGKEGMSYLDIDRETIVIFFRSTLVKFEPVARHKNKSEAGKHFGSPWM